MEELISHAFEDANIPTTWFVQSNDHTYERGCLRSGRCTELLIPLPGHEWNRIRIEAVIEPFPQAVVECSDTVSAVALKVKESEYSRHCAVHFVSILAESFKKVPDRIGERLVAFEFDRGRMSGTVDGEEFISATDYSGQPFMGWLKLAFWNDCLVHRIRILAADPLPAPPYPVVPRRKDFFLDMAVDFYDDFWPDDSALLLGERLKYSRAMYDEFFAQLKKCGVRRVAWNYHDLMESNKTFTHGDLDLGDNFGLAVEMAHRHGLQIFGTIKPLENGYFADFNKKQPGFLMARKPGAWGDGENKIIQRIDLVKEDDRPCAFGVGDVTLFVSDDNKRYVAYTGPIQREEVVEEYPVYEPTSSGTRKTGSTKRSRVMRLSGLEIPQRYIVVSVPSRKWSFANTLGNLIHLFGEKGEERMVTFGTASNTEVPFVPQGGLDNGIQFDLCIGTPTAHLGVDPIREPFILDIGQGFIGIERGKKQFLEVLGSPSYAEVREWWLSWVRGILASGGDGVEIRRTNHTSTFTWGEWGFEEPVRVEFLKRTGVDIWKTDDLDKALWRRIRGEGYTRFLHEARNITRKAGKTLGVHIDLVMEREPGHGAAMDIHWDWRTWIREGLADYVLLKDIWPGSRFAREILSLAHANQTDAVVSLYAFIQWKQPGSERILEERIRATRDAGFDGYQYYDSAGLLRGLPDRQRVVVKNPAIREMLRRQFA